MPLTFKLCPDCLGRYRALRFDASVRWGLCLIPYASLVWPDEHPPLHEDTILGHHECKHSVILLTTARKNLWRTGRLEPEWEALWREAVELLPDWPGFHRRTLSATQLQDHNACEQEVNDMMDNLQSNASIFAAEDKGGGVIQFIAHPRQPPPA